MNLREKVFALDKIPGFFIIFTNVQICGDFGLPLAPVFPWFGMSCGVDSGTRDFELDSSRLFYLCKFNLAVHPKCRQGAFCMDYEVKLQR